jgi:opacity protein-like surface antigen
MKTCKLASILVLGSALATSAFAQHSGSDPYLEIGLMNQQVKDNVDSGNNATPRTYRIILGKDINHYASFEIMAASSSTAGTDTQATPDSVTSHMYGAYVKPKLQLGSGTDVFLRGGVAYSSVTYNNGGSINPGAATTFTGTKFSGGVGIETSLTRNVYVALDYMTYGTIDTAATNQLTSKGTTVSVGYRF